MKVKIFSTSYGKEKLENELNEFIQDKKVIDIKFTEVCVGEPTYETGDWSALVMYEDISHEA